ncbi:Nicotinate dehydrogenase FAD-subunit [Thalassoglobus neptunius]|uniref:Nicotinate dehydrogenase FAD-subunit n=1 Tax=Thalassoglobus neptunius TaxID=1938619 RepID=A0A5C5XB24_9PLAN|nr:xanthine dehydrogenase family protein subunit M [Thalassoglobus neptunius]TWT59092.1 Nicotinate dehydrogenase FAD-subunit [Thalassoglobus neptunius]
MRDFEYEAPQSLNGAIQLLNQERVKPLAGGTDLIDHIRIGRVDTDLVVDIKKIPELNVLEVNPNGMRLGAAVPCRRIIQTSEVKELYPAIHDVCSIIGGIQIQSRASVGGNLCTSGAAADSTPALIALGAVCIINGPDGEREVPVEEFCTGPGANVLKQGELLVELRFPPADPNSSSHYRRFIPRYEMDIAVVGVGTALTLDESHSVIKAARVGLGAVAPKPFLASKVSEFLIDQPVNEETFTEAGNIARTLVAPIDDHRGTVEFRTHVTGVLVQRVLAETAQRIQQS